MSLYTSILTAGTNSHQETSENANAVATDFVSQGVIGAVTNTSGVAPSTGAFAVNAQGTPDMTVAVSSGIAWVQATPTSQNSQMLRVRNTASANVTISANSSGSTKYDWVYIQIDATKAANPASDASDVATLVTSRSSSSSVDNGTPPTYGYCIAVVTVANGASSITNGNIADKRALANTTPTGTVPGSALSASAITLGYAQITSTFSTTNTSDTYVTGLGIAVTIPSGGRKVKVTVYSVSAGNSTANGSVFKLWSGASAGTLTTQLQQLNQIPSSSGSPNQFITLVFVHTPSAGPLAYSFSASTISSGTTSVSAGTPNPAFILVEAI